MPRIQIDSTIARKTVDGFPFPLGVYPVEDMKAKPVPGYYMQFEAADGEDAAPRDPTLGSGDGESWEEWPDRFMFDILVPANRLAALCRVLYSLLPGRVFPILDVLGADAYREIDPYIAYDQVGLERFLDATRAFGDWFYEDGLVGFGAMSLDPFIYFFVDEHKVVTLRVEPSMRERIEKLLAAFELGPVEELTSADCAAHEHRGVLLSTPNQAPDILIVDEVIERLKESWLLELNIDGRTNVDDDGNELGLTAWRCIARAGEQEDAPPRYAEILLTAACLDEAESLAEDAMMAERADKKVPWFDLEIVSADRVTPETFGKALGLKTKPKVDKSGVRAVRWLEAAEESKG